MAENDEREAELGIAREQWLYDLMRTVAPVFKRLGRPLPDNIRLGVGYTSTGLRRNSASIGECLWPPKKEIEVTIRMDQEGTVNVAHILIHELCHAALPVGTGHKQQFWSLMAQFGLDGGGRGRVCKSVSNVTPEFGTWLNSTRANANLGEYPQRGWDFQYEDENKKKPKPPQAIRLECPYCGSRANQSRQWFARGPARCGNRICDYQGTGMIPIEPGAPPSDDDDERGPP